MKHINCEIFCDDENNGNYDVFAKIYSDNPEEPIGVCNVHSDTNKTAFIAGIGIHEESERRKHYGTKLWNFIETYITKKYKPTRFIGKLDSIDYIPAVEFWEKQNFQINANEEIWKEIIY